MKLENNIIKFNYNPKEYNDLSILNFEIKNRIKCDLYLYQLDKYIPFKTIFYCENNFPKMERFARIKNEVLKYQGVIQSVTININNQTYYQVQI